MNRLRLIFLSGLFLFCITMTLSAFGSREKNKAPDRNIVQITGVVRLIGTGLFPELVITGSESDWYIASDDHRMLHDLQHRIVTVEGEETTAEIKFANGMSAGIRRELKNIRIISVE